MTAKPPTLGHVYQGADRTTVAILRQHGFVEGLKASDVQRIAELLTRDNRKRLHELFAGSGTSREYWDSSGEILETLANRPLTEEEEEVRLRERKERVSFNGNVTEWLQNLYGESSDLFRIYLKLAGFPPGRLPRDSTPQVFLSKIIEGIRHGMVGKEFAENLAAILLHEHPEVSGQVGGAEGLANLLMTASPW